MSFTPGSTDEPACAQTQASQARTESQKVVRGYRELARDTANRIGMIKDSSCVSALILFLDDEDKSVVHTSLETLGLLAQNPTNKKLMKSQEKLIFCLNSIVTSLASHHDTQVMAQQVLDSINFSARSSLRR